MGGERLRESAGQLERYKLKSEQCEWRVLRLSVDGSRERRNISFFGMDGLYECVQKSD